jgi:hypothetical protein
MSDPSRTKGLTWKRGCQRAEENINSKAIFASTKNGALKTHNPSFSFVLSIHFRFLSDNTAIVLLWLLFCTNTTRTNLISVIRGYKVKGISPLKTKRRPLYLRPSPYRAVNTFHLGYKNRSFYAVSGTSRCLFSDKYSVGRAYSCWMLNCWCIT